MVSGGFDGSGGDTADDNPSGLRVPIFRRAAMFIPSAPSTSTPFII